MVAPSAPRFDPVSFLMSVPHTKVTAAASATALCAGVSGA